MATTLIPDTYQGKTLEHEVTPVSQSGTKDRRQIEYIVRFYDRPRNSADKTERLEQDRDLIVRWYIVGAVQFTQDSASRWTGIDPNWKGIPKYWGPDDSEYYGRRLPLETIQVDKVDDRFLMEDFLGFYNDPRYSSWYASHPTGHTAYLADLRKKSQNLLIPPEVWKVTATYAEPSRGGGSNREQAAFRRSFGMSTGTQRVYTAKSSSTYGANVNISTYFAPSANQLNMDMRGRPSGADVSIVEGSYSMTWEDVTWNASDMRVALLAGGKVNSDIWEGFAPGEVMFSGMSAELIYEEDSANPDSGGDRKGNYKGTVTLDFTVRPNYTIQAGEMVPPTLPWAPSGVPPVAVPVQGWDVVHPRYLPMPWGAQLVAIVVSQVDERAAFNSFVPTKAAPLLKIA
jgi:hypothetical protein